MHSHRPGSFGARFEECQTGEHEAHELRDGDKSCLGEDAVFEGRDSLYSSQFD